MMHAMMRAVGHYNFSHARMLARAYRDALFDPAIAAVLAKVDCEARHATASERLNMLVAEVQHMYLQGGDRYASWDVNEEM